VIVDAKSGISGAGRTLKLSSHYSEANEDVAAYGLDGHRHAPEIGQELERTASTAGAKSSGDDAQGTLRVTFTPHLVPMTRGILATCYGTLRPGVALTEVTATYAIAYRDTPCVRLSDLPPHTKWTYGANVCYVHPVVDVGARRLIVVSVLDNLVKGAAGQAIQCANLMFGLDETFGLSLEGVYP
jgi:N-acetyl-gamma-glutamyl-phosphate reductase